MKKEGKDLEGGRCLRGGDGRLGFIVEDRAKIWKEHMEKIMNEKSEWDRMVETDLVEGPVEKVVRNEIVEAMQSMKSGKATGTSEVSVEVIVASGEIGVKVMMELCQRVLDGRGMPYEWKTSVVVPIFKGIGGVMSCGSYRGVKLLEHTIKIVITLLERRIRTLSNLNKMKFGFILRKGTVCAIFIVKRMQEKYQKKDKKLYMCVVDMKKAFDRVPRKVMEWAMRKKGLSKVVIRAVRRSNDGARKRVRVVSVYSEEFKIKVGVYQGSVLWALLFAVVVDIITENEWRGEVDKLLYAHDFVLMSKIMKDLKERFWNWKDALKSKGLKVNTRKTKVIVSRSEGKLLKSKIDPCGGLWEESNGKFSVIYKMWKQVSLQICKNRESYR